MHVNGGCAIPQLPYTDRIAATCVYRTQAAFLKTWGGGSGFEESSEAPFRTEVLIVFSFLKYYPFSQNRQGKSTCLCKRPPHTERQTVVPLHRNPGSATDFYTSFISSHYV